MFTSVTYYKIQDSQIIKFLTFVKNNPRIFIYYMYHTYAFIRVFENALLTHINSYLILVQQQNLYISYLID